MRLLKQLSLDGHPVLSISTSLQSFRTNNDVTNNNNGAGNGKWNNQNFGKNFTEIIERNVRLLKRVSADSIGGNGNEEKQSKFQSNSSTTTTTTTTAVADNSAIEEEKLLIGKALEELNSSIVCIIEMCKYQEQMQSIMTENGKELEKCNKSKLRRHYSTLVDNGNLFRLKHHQFNHHHQHSHSPHYLELFKDSLSPYSTVTNGSNLLELIHIESIIENSIHKMIESNVLILLVHSIANIGFEEKKLARIILTNSLTIELKKNKIFVEYFCEPSNPILKCLVDSYEHCKSDVTLNCGFVIRFACQFEPILVKLIESNYYCHFFSYMQRSSASYPFDVAMDVFYTFKTIMTKHKRASSRVLLANIESFFNLLSDLLLHAQTTTNYVTKRQTLELLTEMFSDPERLELREKFKLYNNNSICLIICFLANPNVQIRLRCLTLLNEFFKRAPAPETKCINDNNNTLNYVAHSTKTDSHQWQMNDLMDRIKFTCNKSDNHFSTIHLMNNLLELKNECQKLDANQIHFINRIIDSLHSND